MIEREGERREEEEADKLYTGRKRRRTMSDIKVVIKF